MKLFTTNPINPSEIREQKYGFSGEGIVDYTLNKKFILFINLYYETIFNNFHTNELNYQFHWTGQNFEYQELEFGIRHELKNKKIVGLFVRLQNSNGKGMDFFEKYRNIGLGLKIFW